MTYKVSSGTLNLCSINQTFGEWLQFIGRIFRALPFSPIWRLQWEGSTRAIGSIFDMRRLEWMGYNLVNVACWSTQSVGHSTSTWQTDRQPRHHSKCHANALRQAAKFLLYNYLHGSCWGFGFFERRDLHCYVFKTGLPAIWKTWTR